MKNNRVTRHKSQVTRIVCLCVMATLCLFSLTTCAWAATTNQISQFGITWTFDKAYEYGQFANGDYWVVGPIKIIAFDPPSTDINGRVKNGSQINPPTTPYSISNNQGFDSIAGGIFLTYTPSLNVSLGVDASHPLAVPVNSSVLSSISYDAVQTIAQLQTIAILTVLPAAAQEGDFRPPYVGTDKAIRFNASSLDYSKLMNLTPVGSGNPSITIVEGYFEKPWIDHTWGWPGNYLRPSNNLPQYAREMALQLEDAVLTLNLNYTREQKATLLKRVVQYGIDCYGIIQSGNHETWLGEGGHGQGRKLAVLFAGKVLNSPAILSVLTKSGDYLNSNGYNPVNPPPDYIHFGEDDQTFYVSDYEVGMTMYSPNDASMGISTIQYTSSDLGLPEWGIRHCLSPEQCNNYWPTGYRDCAGVTYAGTAMAVLIMGMKADWNHDVFFDYADRYYATAAPGWKSWSTLASNLYNAYRADYGPIWPEKAIVLYGDVSGEGEVSAYDAALTAQAAVGLITLTAEQAQAADVSGEGEVSAYDAALIAQKAVGLINKFPIEG